MQQAEFHIKSAKSHGLRFRELSLICHVPTSQKPKFREYVNMLEEKGIVIKRNHKLIHSDFLEASLGIVSRIVNTFGFVTLDETHVEMFIPGKFLMGAMPGDHVLVVSQPSRGSLPEGEIIKIVKEGTSQFIGTLRRDKSSNYYIQADNLVKQPLPITKKYLKGAKVGDKVLCHIIERGERHSDHVPEILISYGDSQTAANCAKALLDINGIQLEFSPEILSLANRLNERGISENEIDARTDLRGELIFTIDGADTKDIDDAISICRKGDFYELGVHIADVSHYVTADSIIEAEAFERGTSIYYANRVIPMLPPALSNGICSLNPGVDRLSFSCIMVVSGGGELVDFSFKKSIIHSRAKGVYDEINQILAGTESPEIKEKYALLYSEIKLMKELADILTRNKHSRGAPEIETVESKIIIGDDDTTSDVKPRTRGASEVIIEEFMLLANEAAASAAKLKEVPFVYRVHEPPSEEKITNLHTALTSLGIECSKVAPDMQSKVLAGLIDDAKGEKIFPIVNNLVLRSMSKAKYHEVPIGHYGLVLENYAQFTSPIRRYPDLTIHRILSDICANMPQKKLVSKYANLVVLAARRSTQTELSAMRLERECEDFYKAEYMCSHIGEEFDGQITALWSNSVNVALLNSIDGKIKVENLPDGEYQYDEMLSLTNVLTGVRYRVGDKVRVRCISANVSSGHIDFELIEDIDATRNP